MYLIQHDAILPTYDQFMTNSVFLEYLGKKAAENRSSPGSIKTHLPFELSPWNDNSKYIIVIRNPKDVVVSFYYHTKGMDKFYDFTNGSFDDFFDLFISGQVEFGDYFHHVNSWIRKRHLKNVFIITYEYMKKNPKESISKIANFISPEYGKKVDSDENFLQKIIDNSSVNLMKKNFKPMDEFVSTNKDFTFIRKGQVNDWKNLMSEEQNKLLNERFNEEANKEPYLLQLWDDYSWLNDSVQPPK